MTTAKKIFKWIGIVLGVLVIVFLGYVAYVYGSYYRLPDNMPLEVSEKGTPLQSLDKNVKYRISSSNVGFGAYSDDFSFFMDGGERGRAFSPEAVNNNITGITNIISDLNPDIMLFQEVDTDGDRSHHVDEKQLIANTLGLQNYSMTFAQNFDSPFLFVPLYDPHGKNKSGLLTISKYRFYDALRRSLPVEDSLYKICDLDRCYEKQISDVATDKHLAFYNVHFSAYTNDDTLVNKQLDILLKDASEEYSKGNYIIVGGDFNRDLLGNSEQIFKCISKGGNWSNPFPYDLLPEGFNLVLPFDKENPIPSNRSATRVYTKGDPNCILNLLDGFIISDNVEKLDAKVLDTGFKYSDHNPVYMDFKLK